MNFVLTGAHTVPPRQCSDCHSNNNYTLNSTACVTCHLKDYQGTTNPSHVTGNFPQACGSCHSTSTWLNATFNHNSTGFPLTGNHTVPPRQCSDCHVNNNYNITTTACVSCHQKDYNGATTPVNHITAAFPTACEACHDTVLWTDGNFNHASTGFPLTGAHTVPPRLCADCHVNNNYALRQRVVLLVPSEGLRPAPTIRRMPRQVSPRPARSVMSTTVWTDSTFNHNNTAFPLTGLHTAATAPVLAIVTVNNNYTTLPTACIGCHQKDYSNTTNPEPCGAAAVLPDHVPKLPHHRGMD